MKRWPKTRNCEVCGKVLKWKYNRTCNKRCSIKLPGRKEKIIKAATGVNNPNWVGDKVKYGSLHFYVKRHFPKPEMCECGLRPPIDLANKGIYDRNIDNWEWLCRRCHMTKDGRIVKFAKYLEEFKKSKPYSCICATCKVIFKTARLTARFCSTKCCNTHFNRKAKEQRNAKRCL